MSFEGVRGCGFYIVWVGGGGDSGEEGPGNWNH